MWSDFAPAIVAHRHDRIRRARGYLEHAFRPAAGFASWVSDHRDFSRRVPAPNEYFSDAVAAQALLDGGIEPAFIAALLELVVSSCNERGFIHFFEDKSLLVADIDCTAVGHSILLQAGRAHGSLAQIVDRLVSNTTADGVIEVYEQPAGEHAGRVDACALANALYLLYQVGREAEAAASQAFVLSTLLYDKYLYGSRYYPCPDTFLYFLSRIVRDFERARGWLLEPLHVRLQERRGADTSCLDRAIRVAASDNVGLVNALDLEVVAHAQREDGSWPAAPFFRFGRTERYFGSEALSTAFALKALLSRSTPACLSNVEPPPDASCRGDDG